MSTLPLWMSRLGLQHPIIQAPMAGTSTPQLAAAVSNAGALGLMQLTIGLWITSKKPTVASLQTFHWPIAL